MNALTPQIFINYAGDVMAKNIKVNQSHFARIPTANIRRSVFDRSHVYKTTFDEGKLIPYFVDEVLPGDTFTLSPTEFCRLSTPIAPFMDNLYFETFFFFIPYRLVWDNWVKMCGEQDNPEDSTDFMLPQVSITLNQDYIGTLPDYLGISSAKAGTGSEVLKVSALPFRAIWLTWNEWFRDENLQKSVKIDKSDKDAIVEQMGVGSSNVNYGLPAGIANIFMCPPRGKRYDYFTSALPWPQKGPAVDLPLGATASVTGGYNSVTIPVQSMAVQYSNETSAGSFFGSNLRSGSQVLNGGSVSSSTLTGSIDASKLSVDLSSASAVTINSLRQAFMLQRYYEIDARGGTRYTEKLVAHFGVTNPDSRLQRPEYLGGHSSMFNINPVAQTSSSDSTSPQGNLAAYGVHGRTYRAFQKSFTEFGVIIGFCNVRADLTYQQGTNRFWFRRDVLDFYWPSFAALGEQTVLNQEIYAQGTSSDTEVFGYQERYAEYRYKPSLITGKFRSTIAQPLDVWHLSQEFDNLPKLSDEFIQDHPPISRVTAVQDEPHFLLDVKFNLKCIRPMPLFGIPGNTPHF
ncbi:VP1 [Gokushovirus WZ-2015a]|nr:VP1 [Gokushovirus WZ-2015a]